MTAATFAPIAIFAYKRPDHLERVLDALEACEEFKYSDVFIFSDGPKGVSDQEGVARVREMLRTRAIPNARVQEAPVNRGLAASITSGVSELCGTHGRVIVIEDDLIVHPSTLAWFNEGLDRFADDERVWQISAHQFDVPRFSKRRTGLFLRMTTSWGWATWERAWAGYDGGALGWEQLAQDAELRLRFNMGGSYDCASMLERQMRGEIDSWAIRWWWSVFRAGAYGLFPSTSLVQNVGFDETATHYRFGALRKLFRREACVASSQAVKVPEEFHFDPMDQAAFEQGRGSGLRQMLALVATRVGGDR